MIQDEIGIAKDRDLVASLVAMKRAAAAARRQAIQTGTAIVVMQDRQIVHLTAEILQKQVVL